MLRYADIRVIPEHGEIYNNFELPYYKVRGGITGSIDIIKLVNKLYSLSTYKNVVETNISGYKNDIYNKDNLILKI